MTNAPPLVTLSLLVPVVECIFLFCLIDNKGIHHLDCISEMNVFHNHNPLLLLGCPNKWNSTLSNLYLLVTNIYNWYSHQSSRFSEHMYFGWLCHKQAHMHRAGPGVSPASPRARATPLHGATKFFFFFINLRKKKKKKKTFKAT